jgi:tol-pal system protein YbgF
MKKILIIVVLLIGLIFLSGCATRRQMAETNLQIVELRREHRQLLAAIARMDTSIVEQSTLSKKLSADLKLSMTAIEERMLLVESSLEDAGTRFSRAVETMETRRPKPAVSDSADTSKATGELDPQKIYNAAYYDVIKGNYKMAVKGFEEYLKQYPQTGLSDNAVYWIGECYYIQKDYPNAQQAFTRLTSEYPKSEHLASAKLKLGMSLYNQRYKTKAKQYFQDVVQEFPGTEEANQAAEMLQRYN